MVRDGCFDDVDIAISWHPAAFNRVDDALSLANTRIDFTFIGRASHAAGRAASRAQRARRGRTDERRRQLHARAHAVGRAHPLRHARCRRRRAERGAGDGQGALRDPRPRSRRDERADRPRQEGRRGRGADDRDARSRRKVVSAVSNLLGNTPLEEAMQRVFDRLGAPRLRRPGPRLRGQDPGDAVGARTSSPPIAGRASPVRAETPLCDWVVPRGTNGEPMLGSTDVGDVSLGGADRAGARRHACDRHARAFLAGDGAGQDAGGAQGAWCTWPR